MPITGLDVFRARNSLDVNDLGSWNLLVNSFQIKCLILLSDNALQAKC